MTNEEWAAEFEKHVQALNDLMRRRDFKARNYILAIDTQPGKMPQRVVAGRLAKGVDLIQVAEDGAVGEAVRDLPPCK